MLHRDFDRQLSTAEFSNSSGSDHTHLQPPTINPNELYSDGLPDSVVTLSSYEQKLPDSFSLSSNSSTFDVEDSPYELRLGVDNFHGGRAGNGASEYESSGSNRTSSNNWNSGLCIACIRLQDGNKRSSLIHLFHTCQHKTAPSYSHISNKATARDVAVNTAAVNQPSPPSTSMLNLAKISEKVNSAIKRSFSRFSLSSSRTKGSSASINPNLRDGRNYRSYGSSVVSSNSSLRSSDGNGNSQETSCIGNDNGFGKNANNNGEYSSAGVPRGIARVLPVRRHTIAHAQLHADLKKASILRL
ncbi:hypothetical protein HDU76_012878 [Blyttiomyces sp. JEL0837]|nr:hypothetical protein HDU76_012878 [Blyttiomyces sp. JEL0837]